MLGSYNPRCWPSGRRTAAPGAPCRRSAGAWRRVGRRDGMPVHGHRRRDERDWSSPQPRPGKPIGRATGTASRPSPSAISRERGSALAGGLELRAGGHLGTGAGRDVDRFAGLRVAAGAGRGVGLLDLEPAGDRHLVALADFGRDGLEHRVERRAGILLGNASRVGHRCDEFALVHDWYSLLCSTAIAEIGLHASRNRAVSQAFPPVPASTLPQNDAEVMDPRRQGVQMTNDQVSVSNAQAPLPDSSVLRMKSAERTKYSIIAERIGSAGGSASSAVIMQRSHASRAARSTR